MAALIHQLPHPMLQFHSPSFNIVPIPLSPELILLHRLPQTFLPKAEAGEAGPLVSLTLTIRLLEELLQRLG